MFEVLSIVRINNSVGLQGIINFPLLRDAFPFRLARGIPPKKGVPEPLQSKVRTPPAHLRCTILVLQISLNTWFPPCPLHSYGQCVLHHPCCIETIVAHLWPEESHLQTQHVPLYPAQHLAMLALPILSVVLKPFLPPSLIQKLARSLWIHCKHDLLTGIRVRCRGNCNCKQCLHLDLWSPAVATFIDSVTQTWHVLYVQ